MNEILINYLKKHGFSVTHVDYPIGQYKEPTYVATCRDYRRFLYLQWNPANYPSVQIWACDNKSTAETRELVGFPYAGTLKHFTDGFKKCYIKKYGYLRWYFRPIAKPFFKYLRPNETKFRSLTYD